MRPATLRALLSATLLAGFFCVSAYQASGYLIGLIYGGAMKAHRAAEDAAERR